MPDIISLISSVVPVILWGLLLISSIVFIHEAGHFLAARAFGLRVKEFMIGLPGPKIGFKRKDTYYGVSAIPLGGYCMIAGMEKGAEDSNLEKALTFIAYFGKVSMEDAERACENLGFDLPETLDVLADWGTVRRYKAEGQYLYAISEATFEGKKYAEGQTRNIDDPAAFLAAERKLTYTSLPWWRRVVILLAGSFTNLVVAFAILIVLLMSNGPLVPSSEIASVVEDSPAAEAGLVPGDTLKALNDEYFETWGDFVAAVQSHEPGTEVELTYLHEEEELTTTLTLAERDGVSMVGVTPVTNREAVSFTEAAGASVDLIGMTFVAILQLFNPTTFADTIGDTSSIVGISIEASSAAASGPQMFILLIAALSLSIGFLNLLPIPPLDGGKIVLETIERVIKRKLPPRVVYGVNLVGIAAMLMLFLAATNADIQRYFLGG